VRREALRLGRDEGEGERETGTRARSCALALAASAPASAWLGEASVLTEAERGGKRHSLLEDKGDSLSSCLHSRRRRKAFVSLFSFLTQGAKGARVERASFSADMRHFLAKALRPTASLALEFA